VTEAPAQSGSQDDLASLRDSAVDQLVENGTITSKQVEAAMRTVPRHLFIPEAAPEEAYDPFRAFVTKRDADGNSLSSVSDMHVMAWMLEQTGIEPGMNILEIGSGGCCAALLSEVTGPTGRVTTLDIDQQVTDRASRLLHEAGYPRVHVTLGDAERGFAEHAPYDRILVTYGAWDVPPAWQSQLVPDGRLVMALRLFGLQRVIAFEKDGGHLVSKASKLFGFVAAQGEGAHRSKLFTIPGGVTLRFDDESPAEPGPLARVLSTPRAEEWTGAVAGNVPEHYDTEQMWLATSLPGFCLVQAEPGTTAAGSVEAIERPGSSLGAVRGADLAYVVTRPCGDGSEFGVHAFGPGAPGFAAEVAGHIREWAAERRDGPRPVYRVVPGGGSFEAARQGSARSRVIRKVHSSVVVSWPAADNEQPGQELACHQP
jgi:protein-L-isoaspartate(D-aspartate) O-methyltransferase